MTLTSKERLKNLLNKQVRQVCTQEETRELAQLIAQSDDELLNNLLLSEWENYVSPEVLPEDKSAAILDTIFAKPKQTRVFSIRPLLRYAAAAAITGVALLVFFNQPEKQIDLLASNEIEQIQLPSAQETVDYTRNIALPDGSSVILHKGSTLCYDEREFAQTTREVTLSGEAYFDVAHKDGLPFVIHSGTVKTIVLGTAFSIKAWENQKNVVVTVTRGKVKVENNNEVLAVLTANQQLDYNSQESQIQILTTSNDTENYEWIKEDMTFNQVPLSQIVSVLEKRYKAKIHIREQVLGEKIIVSSFNGTESLTNVLDMLCLIMPEMSYEIDKENNITINKLK
jgi:ferric-dicitrate binding protein FerR (iron transport regulator)